MFFRKVDLSTVLSDEDSDHTCASSGSVCPPDATKRTTPNGHFQAANAVPTCLPELVRLLQLKPSPMQKQPPSKRSIRLSRGGP